MSAIFARKPDVRYTGQSGMVLAREVHSLVIRGGKPECVIGPIDKNASDNAIRQIQRINGLLAVHEGTTLIVQKVSAKPS